MAATSAHLRFDLALSRTALLLALHAALLHHDCAARPTPSRVVLGRRQQIDAVYNFGDSLSDTGNLLREVGAGSVVGSLPYGETLGEPTGRSSDGLLMIDYLANFLNLPYLPPYLDKSANLDHGANFAVAGATALDRSFLLDRGINVTFTNSSLSIQLQWFKTHLSSLCASKEEYCEEKLGRALFLVGEIGGNDYNYGLWYHNAIQEMKAYVPLVVGRIVDAVKVLIDLGAAHLIVPGNFPIGCHPSYLTQFEGANYDLDQNNCIEDLNEFCRFHNDQLQGAVDSLRRDHPRVTIEYADYYNVFLSLLTGADKNGFDQDSLLKACCGIGGAHNYDPSRTCGSRGVPTCTDPAKFISWDGLHLTQAAYKDLATQLFGDYLLRGKDVAA
ncbi:hypothetical protein Taro_043958 [Colocasia esculenta]|uniref:GDSL esterase/lipase n=1 Tax=Colocasia esculenta TaxID=4460 RepID=A0A843WMF4_COLES|nr:hypothetical protein [Colocasia esculenta]